MRLLRIVGLILRAWCTLLLVFPRLDPYNRSQSIMQWSRAVLDCLGLQVQISPNAQLSGIVIANHISWLDIVAINSVHPCVFVAKSEVGRWPILGTVMKLVGTIFAERNRRDSAAATIMQMQEHLLNDSTIAFFPEGTTTDGKQLAPLKPALFQAAVQLQVPITPVAVGYFDDEQQSTTRYCFIGDTGFVESLWTIAGFAHGAIHLQVLPPLQISSIDRKSLTKDCEKALSEAVARFRNCM